MYIWSSIKVCGGGQGLCGSVQFALLGFSGKPLTQTQIHCLVNHPSLKVPHPKSMHMPPCFWLFKVTPWLVQLDILICDQQIKISLGRTDFQGIRIMEDTTKSAQVCSFDYVKSKMSSVTLQIVTCQLSLMMDAFLCECRQISTSVLFLTALPETILVSSWVFLDLANCK